VLPVKVLGEDASYDALVFLHLQDLGDEGQVILALHLLHLPPTGEALQGVSLKAPYLEYFYW